MAAPQLPDGRDVPVQEADPTLLSADHEWNLAAEHNISFRHIIEENSKPRTDVMRYKLVANINVQEIKNAFSQLCGSKTLFKIPDSLRCDRNFSRDVEELYYLSDMDMFLRNEQDMRVVDLPILKRPLHIRMFCAFSRKMGYLTELFERRRLQLWLPFDAPENKHFSDAELSAFFPGTENWVNDITQPPALPVPLPFVVYYFHLELRQTQKEHNPAERERMKRLQYCLEQEYYVLFMACWWNESFHGGRQFILEKATIDILDHHCNGIPEIAGKPAQAILEHMRNATERHAWTHNWMCFREGCMEPSTFIWSTRGKGSYDPEHRAGLRVWCTRMHRRITSSRYSTAIFKRNTILERRITLPDLDNIQGLLGLVHDQGWNTHGSVRVGDLLHHFLALYRATHSQLAVKERLLEECEKRLEYTERRLEDREHCLYESERRLDEARRRNDDTHRRLLDAQYALDHFLNSKNALRSVSDREAWTRGRDAGHPEYHQARNEPESPQYSPVHENRVYPVQQVAAHPKYSEPRTKKRRVPPPSPLPCYMEGDTAQHARAIIQTARWRLLTRNAESPTNFSGTPTSPFLYDPMSRAQVKGPDSKASRGNLPESINKLLQTQTDSSGDTPEGTGRPEGPSAGMGAQQKSNDPLLGNLLKRHPDSTSRFIRSTLEYERRLKY